jgi:hypothetical protein
MPFPKPKAREKYTAYVKRSFNYVKRNKTALRGSYKGRGKSRTLDAKVVMARIGKEWRAHTRRKK